MFCSVNTTISHLHLYLIMWQINVSQNNYALESLNMNESNLFTTRQSWFPSQIFSVLHSTLLHRHRDKWFKEEEGTSLVLWSQVLHVPITGLRVSRIRNGGSFSGACVELETYKHKSSTYRGKVIRENSTCCKHRVYPKAVFRLHRTAWQNTESSFTSIRHTCRTNNQQKNPTTFGSTLCYMIWRSPSIKVQHFASV